MESVNEALNELDWKTLMNAARKRQTYNKDKAEELERHAQKAFMRQHGRDGQNHNYEGDSPEYLGRRHYATDRDFNLHGDRHFKTKNPTHRTWTDDETGETVTTRQYRHGSGIPHINYGQVFDDTAEITDAHSFNGVHQRRHTFNYTKDGEKYNPNLSTVGDEISVSTNSDYNRRQNAMRKDMENYYTGKSKYHKGQGWK
jgi:hypothetical protein